MEAETETTVIDGKTCRICLSPNSAFINVFSRFHTRQLDKIIFQVCRVKVNRLIFVFCAYLTLSRLDEPE